MTVMTDDRRSIVSLRDAGYRMLRHARKGPPSYAAGGELAATRRGYTALEWGQPRLEGSGTLDHDRAELFMDPRDLSKDANEAAVKGLRSFIPIRFEVSDKSNDT